uniref:Glycerophosphodiester phosphodiesterase 1 n=1 Tax=Callorhinchus milii TaxID=7868 RepID=A0A4W3I7H8_CALMI
MLCAVVPRSHRSLRKEVLPKHPFGLVLYSFSFLFFLSFLCSAAKNKATGVELDVEFTADGVPILMHDDNVDRTTDGTGPLDRWTFEEIRKLNPAAKHKLHKIFPNEKIPTLKEAIMECLKYNLTIFFDVKGHSSAALKLMYREFPELYGRSIVCSFEPMVIIKMRHADQNVVTALTHRPWRLSHTKTGIAHFSGFWLYWYQLVDLILDWSLHTILWKLCGISAFLMEKSYISMSYIQQWADRGVEVVAWSVNDSYEKCYYENILNCTYITDTLQEQCHSRNVTIENTISGLTV